MNSALTLTCSACNKLLSFYMSTSNKFLKETACSKTSVQANLPRGLTINVPLIFKGKQKRDDQPGKV